ncbi:unnamed protein product [Blepharisma stoltei]|uniref:Peptidase M20 dimerisation domain-containing protein n=1 Tax=Blepharisma stoltei TaxID=1481888 RepID=A0AAU9IJJ5_9CILI|nr:unnamed protein product [Blepharisma stoltei]
MDSESLRERLEAGVDNGIIPTLMDYIRVPSLSPAFDKDWETNGKMEQAMEILVNYVKSLNITGFTHEILKEPGIPWLFFAEFPATAPGLGTVLMYGHMDKQPHFSGWIEGADNTSPAIIDGKLYGRGGADDGYALPSAALIIKTMDDLGIPRGRIVYIGENEEESGSDHLMDYVKKLKHKIGEPDIIVCLDSGIGDYEHFWLTGSLRGFTALDVTVKVLTVGQHSGDVSGVVPSSFRVFRQILDRIEDPRSGEILIPELYTPITPEIYEHAAGCARALGPNLLGKINWQPGMQPVTHDPVQLVLNRTYRPTLCVTGAQGLPDLANAGNLLRPSTTFRLSVRLPPGVDSEVAAAKLHEVITKDPPYGATIEVKIPFKGNGFAPNPLEPWLSDALNVAGHKYFGNEFLVMGEGGSIPFMGMLGKEFPQAQFMIIGILSSDSNAHSANENFSIAYLKKLLCCLSEVLAQHGRRTKA